MNETIQITNFIIYRIEVGRSEGIYQRVYTLFKKQGVYGVSSLKISRRYAMHTTIYPPLHPFSVVYSLTVRPTAIKFLRENKEHLFKRHKEIFFHYKEILFKESQVIVKVILKKVKIKIYVNYLRQNILF